ncbi:hypothetical protein ULG90_09080 [Halopseudomonas pachastrellae]|nr:hypothetical protein ULG90_09080 [Halopseudomonas pachastrellae]
MDPSEPAEAAAELPEHSVEADPVPAVVEPQTAEASGTSTAPVSFEGELQRAKAIFRNGKEAVRSMFQEGAWARRWTARACSIWSRI